MCTFIRPSQKYILVDFGNTNNGPIQVGIGEWFPCWCSVDDDDDDDDGQPTTVSFI